MAEEPRPAVSEEWEPATSEPGEVFTPEGQIASAAAFARGWNRRDRRGRTYRRSMAGAVLICVAAAVVIVLISFVVG